VRRSARIFQGIHIGEKPSGRYHRFAVFCLPSRGRDRVHAVLSEELYGTPNMDRRCNQGKGEVPDNRPYQPGLILCIIGTGFQDDVMPVHPEKAGHTRHDMGLGNRIKGLHPDRMSLLSEC